jgi:nucleotide-binding universal stress UspA family protein
LFGALDDHFREAYSQPNGAGSYSFMWKEENVYSLLMPSSITMNDDGGAVMWDRLLFAIDQYESGQTALEFTAGLAAATGTEVRVIHVRELSGLARVPPLESSAEANSLVDQAVFSLRLAGVGAEGRACSLPEDQVARRIVDESLYWVCDAIVLGTRRLRGISRVSGRGVRDRILRLSPLPVIAAPTPLCNGVYGSTRLRSMPKDSRAAANPFRVDD